LIQSCSIAVKIVKEKTGLTCRIGRHATIVVTAVDKVNVMIDGRREGLEESV